MENDEGTVGRDLLNVQRVSREHFFSKPSSSETTPRRRRDPESRVGVKLRLISLVLPAGVARERYLEEWMDERNGIRRGIFPKRRFWALTVLFGAIGQSYESRVHARRQVDWKPPDTAKGPAAYDYGVGA